MDFYVCGKMEFSFVKVTRIFTILNYFFLLSIGF